MRLAVTLSAGMKQDRIFSMMMILMIEDGFMSADELGKKISESNWEYIDLSIRCWLLCDAVTDVIDKMYDD